MLGLPPLLWVSYRRYLARHWWLPWLSLCAIATGVAVILGIDIASVSARRSFALSTQALTGAATHSLVAAGSTVPDAMYRQLRVDWGLRRSAPVVEGYVSFPDLPGAPTVTLLGVDLLTDRAIRDWTGSQGQGNLGLGNLNSANQVVVSAATAQRWGWQPGAQLTAELAGRRTALQLAGVLTPDSAAAATALDNLLLADIATAQQLLGQSGLDRIDLVLSPEEFETLTNLLPPGFVLQSAGSSQQTASELSAAFHTSLQALSYLCLLVATFLIFNVVSFTVAHRRQSLGRLRVLGMTSRELARLLLGEAMVLGVLGSLLGCLLGALLGRGLVPLVTRTLNDLYYVQSITRFAIEPSWLLKAFLAGVLATVVAAAVPIRLTAQTEPLALLHRVAAAHQSRRWAWQSAGTGAALLLLGAAVLLHPSLGAGFFCLLCVVLGYGLLVPVALQLSVRWGRGVSARLGYRMALQGLIAFFSRSATAAVALTIAVAATVSIATMVSSFRGTLSSWLEVTLTADIYMTLRDRASITAGETLDPAGVERAIALPGVRGWTGQRVAVVPSETVETMLVGVRGDAEYLDSLPFVELSDQGRERFLRGEGVFLTEPYARRAGKRAGQSLRLQTPDGPRELPVLGVYYSYAPDRNSALWGSAGFEPIFGGSRYSGLALSLDGSVPSSEVVARLRSIFGETVEVRATGELKALALEIFERTFTVTEVLRYLALGVAVVGVLLSLMALAIERESEVQVLRALGFRRREMWSLALTQSAWLGGVAGLLAGPLGLLLAALMIAVINRRAFGWSIELIPDPWGWLSSLLLGLLAAVLAGLYPAWRWRQAEPAEALRERE